ncbi:barstar family protein [Actinacidiphila acidipaludis]|uniref:Barstar family protein n=1 Tax=Actinacidiphila acidipaludis TaxID=2873382 RepID=A0ABS7Q653_9ACTN|nr:barstar family protein [Streptomyces acidipaludis]MBY8878632.1 barstar family protein [Streptomyces acidipaludis]
MITIDVGAVGDERELHALLAVTLRFPSFYGMNWDAFWDAITGLVQIPDHLHFVGWAQLGEHVPYGATMLQQALDRYQSQYRPEFVAEYV